MQSKFYGDLPQRREEWKRQTLLGGHTNLDYRRFRKQRIINHEIPLGPRYEGMWVVGLPGTGKTQLFQYLISLDLDMVARGEASIIVIDPTGDEEGTLIHNLTRLKRFARGGDLHGRLIYIDPTDEAYTLPINLLSINADLNSRKAVSSAISSYVSIMGGLMGQPLTNFQDPVFRYAIQAALAFPNPTLHTLRRIIELRPRNSEATPYHYSVLPKLHPTVQQYLSGTYESDGARRSRGEIMNRLYTLSSDPNFRDIFESEETKIHIGKEMNEAKVIVINASRDHLHEMKELYARYFLALIKSGGERRPASSIPCFVYIDECDEFVAHDRNAADIIFKLRRKRVALILGNQEVDRIKEPRSAFLGTAIKMVNCDPDSADELGKTVRLTPQMAREYFVDRPPLDFAFHIRGRMQQPQSFKVPLGVMEALPKMTEEEWEDVRAEIRERYYIPVNAPKAQDPSTPASDEAPMSGRVPASLSDRSHAPPVQEIAQEGSRADNSHGNTEAGKWFG